MSQLHQDAITAALAGDWQGAHNIVKDCDDPFACWIHAVLHKIEGDAGNSRYWYAQTAHDYADFADPRAELAARKRRWRLFERCGGDGRLFCYPNNTWCKRSSAC